MGRRIGEVVGRRLGRSLLELGGNNGIIVAPSANLDLALRAVLFAAMIPFVRPAIDYVGSFQHSCWTISGKLTITDANNADIHYPPLFNAVRARTVPDTVAFDDPEYVITVRADESGGLPPITVYLDKMPEFTPQVLDIESVAGKRDTFHKKISNVGLLIKRTTVNATFDARPQ